MEHSTKPTLKLLNTRLFSPQRLSPAASALRSMERAKAVGLAYGINTDDVANLTDKFWNVHRDYVFGVDGAALTLLTIHYNLAAGTLTQYLDERSDLQPLLDDIMAWRVNAQFCLTEIGHGLDAANIQTEAVLLSNGAFRLNTPSPSAAKFMPPTVPMGIPCVAVVWARLKVDDEDRGIRPFIVTLNDGRHMSPGVTAKLLPHRGGAPVNHSLTSFHNVILPSSAMLGPYETLPTFAFLASIFRVAVGTLALGAVACRVMPHYAYISAKYSIRRTVTGASNEPSSILNFRTQQIPVLTCVANAMVACSFDEWAVEAFRDQDADMRVRHGIAACMKVVAVQLAQDSNIAVSDRCGAQGVFNHNQMSTSHSDHRGIAIAEGDTLVLSIRLATELILERYELPEPQDPHSILARHEASLIQEAKDILSKLPSHRHPEYNRQVLPLCLPIVEAIGHRMAYDAAVSASLPKCVIDLYVCSVMKRDAAWYSEVGGMNRSERYAMESQALDEVGRRLEEFLQMMGVEPYVVAPIVTDQKWDQFVSELPTYTERFNNPQPAQFHEMSAMARL